MPSDIASAALNYAHAYRNLHQALSRVLSPFKLTLLEWTFLKVVADDPHLTMSEYAQIMSFDAPHITQLTQTVASKGLLDVEPSRTDKRQKSISLSSLGISQTEAATQKVNEKLQAIFKEVNTADTLAHLRVLEHIISETQT